MKGIVEMDDDIYFGKPRFGYGGVSLIEYVEYQSPTASGACAKDVNFGSGSIPCQLSGCPHGVANDVIAYSVGTENHERTGK